jgi:hypothetical protein
VSRETSFLSFQATNFKGEIKIFLSFMNFLIFI